MKKTKVVLALVCAVLLVGASVMGTLAYLTSSTETVTNTFTVGKVTFGGDDHTAGLDEAKTNVDGQPVNNDNTVVVKDKAPRVIGNVYKLKPAHTYTKDPTIHVGDDSEDCFLFVKVENGITSIEAPSADTADGYKNIEAQMSANGWVKLGEGYDNIWVYCGESGTTPKSVKAGADKVVFDEFMIKGDATNVSLEACKDATITITAYGVQSEGLEGSTAVAIWGAAGFETATDSEADA